MAVERRENTKGVKELRNEDAISGEAGERIRSEQESVLRWVVPQQVLQSVRSQDQSARQSERCSEASLEVWRAKVLQKISTQL